MLAIENLPDSLPALLNERTSSLADAQVFCRRLARSHYENFLVGTCLVPRRLRQHFYNVYAYCRVADDLADESDSPEQALQLLGEWESMLRESYGKSPQTASNPRRHPVFLALADTIARFNIPIEPFADLLVAFRSDQTKTRYATHEEVLQYCRYSANPVGRLVLCLGEYCDPTTREHSDSICTGLQLANFCQDVARDYAKGRIYLPESSMEDRGYSEEMLAHGFENEAFQRLMGLEVDRAEQYLLAGWPLVSELPNWLASDVAIFIRGGLETLRQIRQRGYRVLSARPTVPKSRQLVLLGQTMWQRLTGRLDGARP